MRASPGLARPALLTAPVRTSTPLAGSVPLVAMTRGGRIESVHHGSVAVVDLDGHVLLAAGDPTRVTFARSTLKPFQALPFVAGGGVARFGLTRPEVALLCASHSGEPRHVAACTAILAKAGSAPGDLRCGAHAPGFHEAHGEVPPPPPYSPLAHNCSGKHAGMLAHCVARGYDKTGYLDPAHPLQREVRGAVASVMGVDEAALEEGIDGCSLPNYAMPLHRLALAYARLAATAPPTADGAALATLAGAMLAHPEMVSGDRRSDLVLAGVGQGDWIPKIGAEAVQAIGIRSRGIGIVVKIDDGSRRAVVPAAIAALDQAGCLDATARAALAAYATPVLRNDRGLVTGDLHPLFVLDKPASRSGGTADHAGAGARRGGIASNE